MGKHDVDVIDAEPREALAFNPSMMCLRDSPVSLGPVPIAGSALAAPQKSLVVSTYEERGQASLARAAPMTRSASPSAYV